MFASGLNHALLTLMLLFVVAGCSKNAEIEGLLENYYRAAARGDTDSMVDSADTRAFSMTTSSHRGLLRSKFQQVISEMNELSNANGELKKIDITHVEEVKNNNDVFQKVTFNMVFKNNRTITKKEFISRWDGEAQVYIANEWANAERMLYGY